MLEPSHVDLAGGGGGDEGDAVLLQSFDGFFDLGDQGVNLRYLAIQMLNDPCLLDSWWQE